MPFFHGFSLNAQEKEFGVFVGGSNYFGDLNPSYSFKETRPATSIFYRYNFNPRMSFRAAMGYYWVTASDNKQKIPLPTRSESEFFKSNNRSFGYL